MNKLPPECVERILSYLPLRDLLRSHQVCQLWASLQRSIGTDRQQVTICIGEKAIFDIYDTRFRMPYEDILDPITPVDCEPRLEYNAQNAKDNFDLLQFGWLDSVTCNKLVSLLPNVIGLKVAVREVPPAIAIGEISCGRKSVFMNQIITMLTRWRSTLEAFTVSIEFLIYNYTDNLQSQIDQDHWRLFQAINQLDSLRRLAIEINDHGFMEYAPQITDLIKDIEEPFFSVLSHLEEFSFLGAVENLKLLLPSLIKHGGLESTLKRISLASLKRDGIFPFENDLSSKFTNQMGDWMRNMVNFPNLAICDFDKKTSFILNKFPRLERITIKVDSLVKFPQKLKYLESLLNLTYLEIELKNSNSKYSMNDDMSDDELDEIDRPPVPIGDPCLPSVRVLMIYASDLNHNDLHPFSWPRILPNLEILHYYNTSGNCKICTEHDCIKKVLLPWTGCPRIRHIYSGPTNVPQRWSVARQAATVSTPATSRADDEK